ncbi:MAG: hypothetical protein K0R63_633 [Rickettsiales bacterium]|jgi:hypothetical protein|nr:hypothetical protein [Rickettsiales bacterium]
MLILRNLGIMACFLLSACGALYGEENRYGMFTPMPTWMRNLPKGDDSFSKGFRDGCYHFMGQNGQGMLRLYDSSPNPLAVYDRLYQQGYDNGDRYCSAYVFKATIL